MDGSSVYLLLGVLGAGDLDMSTQLQRQQMAQAIFESEKRPGKLRVYYPPKNDGGGPFEVAGINVKYHPAEAKALRALLNDGEAEAAELRAKRYFLAYTEGVNKWATFSPGVEFYLRDSAFNRGPTGAAKILQLALGVAVDGKVGPKTKKALSEIDDKTLLVNLRAARERYEREYVGYRSNMWAGLKKRWNDALATANKLEREA